MKKDPKLNEKIKQLEAEVAELKTGWQRTQADFENFRKRTEEEKQNFIHFATVNLITELLSVLDNFQRASRHIPEIAKSPNDEKTQKLNQWIEGIQQIEKQLEDVLRTQGLEKIETKPGDQFDPFIHEAVAVEESPDYQTDQIMEIIQTGYKLAEKVIRPVKVKVAK